MILSFVKQNQKHRVFWIWFKEGNPQIFSIEDADFDATDQTATTRMVYNSAISNFQDQQVFETLLRLYKCRWRFVTKWKCFDGEEAVETWNEALPRFESLNHTMSLYSKMGQNSSLTSRVQIHARRANQKRHQLIADVLKRTHFSLVRYNDTRHPFTGVYHNIPMKRQEQMQFLETVEMEYPKKHINLEKIAVYDEILWEEDLSEYMALFQQPGGKQKLIELMGLNTRPLTNGWMKVYDIRYQLRILLFGLQVQGIHHTEYILIFTGLEQERMEMRLKLVRALRNFPESAMTSNPLSITLIDEVSKEGFVNDLITVMTDWREFLKVLSMILQQP
jgi:hypothetical protein